MTNELKEVLDKIKELIIKWNNNQIPNQGEFIDELKPLSETLAAELKKTQPE